MTLRIMLIGLVASMGFELPSGSDLASWTQSGRGWVDARVADLTGSDAEAKRPVDGPTDCGQAETTCLIEPLAIAAKATPADDARFLEVLDAMASESASQPTADPATPAVAADELQIPPVGLPSGEEMATQPALEVLSDPSAIIEVEVDVPTETTTVPAMDPTESSTRADRVSSALRLTRDAARAWVDLMQGSADETGLAQ